VTRTPGQVSAAAGRRGLDQPGWAVRMAVSPEQRRSRLSDDLALADRLVASWALSVSHCDATTCRRVTGSRWTGL
jgi:hypothetical protein